jgi:DNA-binding FadR family transcriptional regulator
LVETLQRLSTLMVLLGPTAYSLAKRVREIGAEHDAINNAIQTHDPIAAKQAASTHLQNAVKARLQIIASEHVDSMD